MSRLCCAAFVCLAVGVAACNPDRVVTRGGSPSASASTPDPGTRFAPARAGELRATASRAGMKGTLVNVWASWCGSCKRELPMLSRIAPIWRERGVAFVTVTVDEPDALPKAERVYDELGLRLATRRLAEPLDVFKAALHPAWPGMLPATFLYDATGKLRYYWGGEAYEQELSPILEGFVAGKAIDGQAEVGLAPGKVE